MELGGNMVVFWNDGWMSCGCGQELGTRAETGRPWGWGRGQGRDEASPASLGVWEEGKRMHSRCGGGLERMKPWVSYKRPVTPWR